MRLLPVTLLSLAIVLSGCGSDDSGTSDTPAATPASTSETSSSTEPEATSSSPADSEAATSEIVATDATELCAEVSERAAPLTMKALENVEEEAEVKKNYNEIADLYEAGVEEVDDPAAKDAFQAMADSFRDTAENGVSGADSDQANQALEDFSKACFGG